MGGRTFRCFTGCIVLIAAISGCASLQGRGGVAPGPSPAEVKLMEENKALDAVNEESSAFYAQLGSLTAEISEFRSRPYWNGFEQILLEYPSLRDPDNEEEITPDMESRLSEWSLKWKAAWEETLEDYLRLVDKCTILEAKRLAVRERLLSVQARYVAAYLWKRRPATKRRKGSLLGRRGLWTKRARSWIPTSRTTWGSTVRDQPGKPNTRILPPPVHCWIYFRPF